eukprot:3441842-Rhodomonas_salina.1
MELGPSKTKAITDWPIPVDIHELRSFIGLANYYCCYVENYAGIYLPTPILPIQERRTLAMD